MSFIFLHYGFFPPKMIKHLLPPKKIFPPKITDFSPKMVMIKISASFSPWDGRPWVEVGEENYYHKQ